jgi:methyl-accepting chemotaxis protein
MLIRTKLIILLSISVLLPVILISLTVANSLRNASIDDFSAEAGDRVALVDRLFTMYLNGLKEDAVFFANTPQILALSSGVKSYMSANNEPMKPLENSEEEKSAFEIMSAFGQSHNDLAYVFLGLDSGGYIQWPSSEINKYDPRVRPWYKEGINATNPVLSKPYKDIVTGAPIIDYLAPFTTNTGLKGVFSVDVTLKKLAQIVNSIKFGNDGYVLLSEADGTILANPKDTGLNFKKLTDLQNDLSKLSDLKPGTHSTNIDGRDWFVHTYQSKSLGWKFYGLIPESEVFAQLNQLVTLIIIISAISVLIFISLGYWFIGKFTDPLYRINESLQSIADGEGDLTSEITIMASDETGHLANSFNRFLESIRALIRNIQNSGNGVDKSANELQSQAGKLSDLVNSQSDAMSMISTAFEEMVATTNEVARNCTEAANATHESQRQVDEGHKSLEQTLRSVTVLSDLLNEANSDMGRLNGESKNIESILDTIKGIAEQTNLLALNAAIEAARAGEQGRGFAVVADEVRTLASRSAASTEEISNLLIGLRQLIDAMSKKTSESLEKVEESKSISHVLNNNLDSVFGSINTIRDMTEQIAASAEEQHQVAEHINQNIVAVKDTSSETATVSSKTNLMSEELKSLSSELTMQVRKFKI